MILECECFFLKTLQMALKFYITSMVCSNGACAHLLEIEIDFDEKSSLETCIIKLQ